MSDSIFPTFSGLTWSRKRKTIFSTGIQTSTSGRERRARYYTYPRYVFTLNFDFLLDDYTLAGDLQAMVSFYNLKYGAYDSFLYKDPNDYTVTNQTIGTGNSVTVDFQLLRTYAGFSEPVFGIVSAPTLYVASVALTSTDFSWSTSGLITFTTAPTGTITADFNFYYRCRFKEDELDLDEFVQRLWELKGLELITLK